ncbi:hypothetical protein [Klebsiella phage vB_KpnS-VAC8]|uniref:Uncharacterized protein n=1 Tax=Klebsiella phage vB_KpnS-VAC8 TaxID=2864366 RepID=A0AAE7XI09_9CAUD|nr:hypothetical protein [Klebsiella phage vB_KpnS-VAC8]
MRPDNPSAFFQACLDYHWISDLIRHMISRTINQSGARACF